MAAPAIAIEFPVDAGFPTRLAGVIFVMYLAVSLLGAAITPFPSPFDEHGHFSYVIHIAETHEFFPAFDKMRFINLDDLSKWTERPNYINHPSGYYHLMSWIARPFVPTSFTTIFVLRLANVMLSVAALALFLSMALRAGWSVPAQLAYITLVATTPVLPVLGRIVSNDNLALLGGALCCLGVFELLRADGSRQAWVMAGGGVILASLAKLTAMLLCGGMLTVAVGLLVMREGWQAVLRRPALVALSLCAAATLPYLVLWATYGSPAPNTEGQVAVLMRRSAELGWTDVRLPFPQYALHFLWSMLAYWPPAPASTPIAMALLALPAACLTVGLLGVAWASLAIRHGSRDPLAAFVLCGALAIAATLVIHIGFSYQRHVETGWLKGIYPRYYLPLLPVFPAACALVIDRLCSARVGVWLSRTLILSALAYAALDWL